MPEPISTSVFPGDDMSPDAIETAAAAIRAVGADVSTHSDDVVTTWGTIASSYVAPESGTLVAAMDPLKTSGAAFAADLDSAATALTTFADAVRAIKKTLEGIRADANAFLGTIHGGKVTATVYGNNEGQTRTEEVPWNEDAVTVSKNNALLAQVEEQAALLRAAEQKCANDILAIIGAVVPVGTRGRRSSGGTFGGPAPAVENPPWGAPVDGPELLDDPIGRGLKKFVADGVQGLASLAGFDTSHYHYDLDDPRGSEDVSPIFTHGWSLANSWHTVQGIGKVVSGLNPLGPVLGMVPGWYGQQFRDNQAATQDFLKSQLAWDDWHDHPGEAATQTVLNVATIVFGVTKVGAVGRAGAAGRAGTEAGEASTAARAAEAASAATRIGEVAPGVGRTLTLPTLDGIKALAKAPATLYQSFVDKLHVKIDVPDHAVDLDRAPHPVHDPPPVREPAPSTVSHAGDRAGSEPVTTRTHGGTGTDVLDRPVVEPGSHLAGGPAHPDLGPAAHPATADGPAAHQLPATHGPSGDAPRTGADPGPEQVRRPVPTPDVVDPARGHDYASGDPHLPGNPEPVTPEQTFVRGSGESGWLHVKPGTRDGWVAYQEQVAGVLRTEDGRVPEWAQVGPHGQVVKFDGLTFRGQPPHPVYLDAKDWGRGFAFGDTSHGYWKARVESAVQTANRQLDALPDGASLEWHVSDPYAAAALRSELADQGITADDLRVIYTPKR